MNTTADLVNADPDVVEAQQRLEVLRAGVQQAGEGIIIPHVGRVFTEEAVADAEAALSHAKRGLRGARVHAMLAEMARRNGWPTDDEVPAAEEVARVSTVRQSDRQAMLRAVYPRSPQMFLEAGR